MLRRLALCTGLLLSLHAGAGAASFTLLHAFHPESGWPNSALLRDAEGNLYGTAAQDPGLGGNIGTIFRIAPDGAARVLYRFRGHLDGRFPHGPLIADTAGNLYGVTAEGGGHGDNCTVKGSRGCGTLFRLAPDGTKTVLHVFRGGARDGRLPKAGVIADAAGNLYGTTDSGGGCARYSFGCGTVYRLAPDGGFTILHAFKGHDGGFPVARLTLDAAGNLYGTTTAGGGKNMGVVFKVAPDGTTTRLYSFRNREDGREPRSEVVLDAAGNLYGTASEGGGSKCQEVGCGTIFKLSPDGVFTVLHSFTGGGGAFPLGGLVADAAGNLYGTTQGGPFDCHLPCGRVFKLAPDGTYSVLYRSRADGGATDFPASLIIDGAGALYGVSHSGGARNVGTAFKLVP